MSIHRKQYTSREIIQHTYQSLKDHLAPRHKKRLYFLAVVILVSAFLDVFGLAAVLPLVKLVFGFWLFCGAPSLSQLLTAPARWGVTQPRGERED